MASENKAKFAVLVHQLPLDCKTDALALLPKKYIGKVTHDVGGLKVYFSEYESARESIIQRTIRVRGILYTICPLVTNLTLHNIRKHASKSTIRNMMSPFGSVIDLYPVEVITKERKCETRSLTDDYRVILDVPEVYADFNLSPLWLPDLSGRSFLVSFFCRLCRENGHMQHQCVQCASDFSRRETSLQQQQHSPGHRRTSYETGCPDTLMNRARYSSNQRSKKRMPIERSKIKTDPVKVKKEQDSTYHIPFIKREFNDAEIGNALTADFFNFKSEPTQSKDLKCDNLYSQDGYTTHADGLKIKVEDSFQQQCYVSQVPDARNESADEVSFKQKDSRIDTPIKKGEDYAAIDTFQMEDYCGNEKRYPSEKRCKKKKPKHLYGKVLRRLVPPDTSLETTKKLLKIVFSTRHEQDIPPEVQCGLQKLLDWNRSRDKKQLKKVDKTFIKWLEMYLAKVGRERNPKEDSDGKVETFRPEDVTGEQPSEETAKKQKSKRQRALGLSPGIEQIVLKTRGTLPPPLLRNFLNQVRGRKKQIEIATHFTTDFHALFIQLEKVEKDYYLYGKRGKREDRDIDFIQRLRNRLIQKCKVKEEVCISSEESCFMRQSSNNKGNPTEFISDIHKNVVCDGQSAEKSILTGQSKTESSSTEIMKPCLHKYVSNNDRSSSSTAQSSIEKYPSEKFKLNLQRNLSYDVWPCRIPSSTRQSSTEDEPLEDFKWVGQRNRGVEDQIGRISSSRKRSSSGEDSPGKFHMNCSFYNVQSTSRRSPTRQPSTDEESLVNSNWGFRKDLSVRISSCTTQYSTDEEPFENCRKDHQRNLPFDTQTTGVSNIRCKSNIKEEKPPDISKLDLQKILSFVGPAVNKVEFQTDSMAPH